LRNIVFHSNSVSFELRTAQSVNLRVGKSAAQRLSEGTHRVTHAL
jgi:hypothetical protein